MDTCKVFFCAGCVESCSVNTLKLILPFGRQPTGFEDGVDRCRPRSFPGPSTRLCYPNGRPIQARSTINGREQCICRSGWSSGATRCPRGQDMAVHLRGERSMRMRNSCACQGTLAAALESISCITPEGSGSPTFEWAGA